MRASCLEPCPICLGNTPVQWTRVRGLCHAGRPSIARAAAGNMPRHLHAVPTTHSHQMKARRAQLRCLCPDWCPNPPCPKYLSPPPLGSRREYHLHEHTMAGERGVRTRDAQHSMHAVVRALQKSPANLSQDTRASIGFPPSESLMPFLVEIWILRNGQRLMLWIREFLRSECKLTPRIIAAWRRAGADSRGQGAGGRQGPSALAARSAREHAAPRAVCAQLRRPRLRRRAAPACSRPAAPAGPGGGCRGHLLLGLVEDPADVVERQVGSGRQVFHLLGLLLFVRHCCWSGLQGASVPRLAARCR